LILVSRSDRSSIADHLARATAGHFRRVASHLREGLRVRVAAVTRAVLKMFGTAKQSHVRRPASRSFGRKNARNAEDPTVR
jgi:hypothetical protein